MGTVVLHAGIPKTGSSSIQTWIAHNAAALESELDLGLMIVRSRVAPGDGHARLHVDRYESGGFNSGAFVRVYLGFKRDPRSLGRLFDGIARFAERHPVSVISSESFAQLFTDGTEHAFLTRLDDLARTHPVRVAYYFRPQHSCLEAMWRQWGFRRGGAPSVYLAEQAGGLHYRRTRAAVAEVAPHVAFEARPFRDDLLRGGSLVVDFAEHFLGAGHLVDASTDTHANVGLPLELVNLLRFAPPELVGRNEHDNASFERLQRLFGGVEVAATSKIARSRQVLTAYCHDRFEAENQLLLAELGFPARAFVPDVAVHAETLDRLDELWHPDASAAELDLVYRALLAALAQRAPSR
jgi:hypothetical protein